LHEFFEANHFFAEDSVGADEENMIAEHLYMLGVKRANGKKYSSVNMAVRPYGFELVGKAHRAGARTCIRDLLAQQPVHD